MTREQMELVGLVRTTVELGRRLQAVLHELARGNAHAQELAWEVTRAIDGLEKDLKRSQLFNRAVAQPETSPDAAERVSAGSAVVVATRTSEPGDAGSTPACPSNLGGPT